MIPAVLRMTNAFPALVDSFLKYSKQKFELPDATIARMDRVRPVADRLMALIPQMLCTDAQVQLRGR
jgi:hypothetical protein